MGTAAAAAAADITIGIPNHLSERVSEEPEEKIYTFTTCPYIICIHNIYIAASDITYEPAILPNSDGYKRNT